MADTTIEVDESVGDRLRTLAGERGLSVRAYVERVVAATPTEAEQGERAHRVVGRVRGGTGPELTDDDMREVLEWRAAIVAGRLGSRM